MNPSLESILLALKPRPAPMKTPRCPQCDSKETQSLGPSHCWLCNNCAAQWLSNPSDTPVTDAALAARGEVRGGLLWAETARQLERRAILAESRALSDDAREAVAGCVEALDEAAEDAIVPVESMQSLGTPGRIIGARCRWCNHDCLAGEELVHDSYCPYPKATAALARLARALGVGEEGE